MTLHLSLSRHARGVVLLAIVVRSAPVHAQPAGTADPRTQIEAILEAQRRDQHIPGFAFVVVKDDQVVQITVSGHRDLGRNLPVTPDTVFPIGSCTKAFTSMALAIAQDARLLSLDDSPRRFLPYFRMADPEADAAVTLRDMLSHRTGLRAYADLAAEPGVLDREEYVRAATSAKPEAKFRSKFQYSNAMYSAAGEVLGRAYHSTWEKVIESRVFTPLGMRSSLTAARAAERMNDHATGYVYENAARDWRAVPPPSSLQVLAPGGNIASSARDMAQWLRLLTGQGRIGDRRLVSEAAFDQVTSPQIAINASMSYALGWATYEWDGDRVIEHNGGSQGISALVSFIPARRAGFVFLANTSPNFMTIVGNAGKLLWPLILGRSPVAPVEVAGLKTKDASPAGVAPVEPSGKTLPSVEALLSRMAEAVGGEETLRRHTALEIHARKSYENHGVTAALTVRAKAPDRHVEQEVWTAAGREIATLRVYFDGSHGGQETTFGQDSINDPQADDRARREFDIHPLLHLKSLYKEVRLQMGDTVDADPTYRLELVPEGGPRVLLYVSTRTALILKRETEGESVTFADYRAVDCERIPFRSTIRDALGETSIDVSRARFNAAMDDATFGARKPSR